MSVFKQLRKEANLSVKEAAVLLKINDRTIRRFDDKGEAPPLAHAVLRWFIDGSAPCFDDCCEGCSKPILKGDTVCFFYSDVLMCEECGTTLDEAIAHQEELMELGEFGPFKNLSELRYEIEKNRILASKHGMQHKAYLGKME